MLITFKGKIVSGQGDHSKFGIPGKKNVSDAPVDWPENLCPGSLNIEISANEIPKELDNLGPGILIKKLDNGILKPAFVIKQNAILNNTIGPDKPPPRNGRGDAQVWRAKINVLKTNQNFACWVLRRLDSGMTKHIELVSSVNLRKILNLVDGDDVLVSLEGGMKLDDAQLAQIKKDFETKLDVYRKLAYETESLLKDKLKSANFKTAYVLSRVKDVDSFMDKIVDKSYDKPFEQTSDIVGIRIVCLYTEDIKRISQLIADNFIVLKTEDKAKNLGSDKMGYQDFHIDVQLKKDTKFLQYRGEIQLRTVMTDASSIISHDLSYKKEPPLPEHLERELKLVSATMELAQYHCNALRARRKELIAQVEKEAADKKNPEIFLNQLIMDDTLRVYTKNLFPELPIKEHIHALILRDLNPNKYKRLKDIDDAIKYSKKFVDYYKTQSSSFKSGSDYITKSLGYYDEEFMIRHPFAQKTREAIKEFKNKNL